jgi:hypothetical protein
MNYNLLAFKNLAILFMIAFFVFTGCSNHEFSKREKDTIFNSVRQSLDEGLQATINKDIELYMKNLPEDLLIFDESGEIISREKQREYALRDWSIIDSTLHISVDIDSINYASRDSIFVYTSQRWERLMFQRDGITIDTVLTTQRHKETWKPNPKGWLGYTIEELGGEIFINGLSYYQ